MRLVRALALGALLVLPLPGAAQRNGGELVFAASSEPSSYDGHGAASSDQIHSIAPFYNTLLRVDPGDPEGRRPAPSLAESWTVSPDGRTYTFRLRRGVTFHDGSEMTAQDVKASYDRIIFPPEGVRSRRKDQYAMVESVEAPDAATVRFRLRRASGSFVASLLSPYNFIYKADILARDARWYESNVMGTGPFTFVEHVKGSHLLGRKNAQYWDPGKPYLDAFRALFLHDSETRVAAVLGERAHAHFHGFSPAVRDALKTALGDRITVQESPWNCRLLVALNHEQRPFNDRRVRRALTLALDRHQASQLLSGITIARSVAGILMPGTPFAARPEELQGLAGYWTDIRASRAAARRLLREAGVPEGFGFTLTNRGVPMPYEPLGIWLVDQWREIGVDARQEVVAPAAHAATLRSGGHEVALDLQCGYVAEPDLDLRRFLSADRSPANHGRYTDRVLDELFDRQSRARGVEERGRLIRAFEKRLLDDEAHYLVTLQWHRIVVHSPKVRGWHVTPGHALNGTLDAVWLAE